MQCISNISDHEPFYFALFCCAFLGFEGATVVQDPTEDTTFPEEQLDLRGYLVRL